MRFRHKTPCAECPWRKVAPAGWLGGWSPELYADAVQNNEIPACHLNDHGPDNPRTSMCAGALAVSRNSAIDPMRTPGAREAARVVGKREDCFPWVRDFYQHHAGKPYMHPLMRVSRETE